MHSNKEILSIVIPTHDRSEKLQSLLSSIPNGIEVVLVAQDISLSAKRNFGYRHSEGEYILFIDDDNIIGVNSIDRLLETIYLNNVGIVGMIGCYARNPNIICDGGSGRNFLTGFTSSPYFNTDVNEIRDKCYYEVDEVANAFMVSRKILDELDGFDETFPIDLDEADLCLRAKKKGYRVIVSTKAVVYHDSLTASRVPNFRRPKNAYYMARNKIIFQKKHKLGCWFIPISAIAYILCLMVRGKIGMVKHFIKGVVDGCKYKS